MRYEQRNLIKLAPLHYIRCFHNATLLRKILPRHLTAPKPLYVNRKARHCEIATGLRVTQAAKRSLTAAKSKATRDANKAKKQSRLATIVEESEPEPGPVEEVHRGAKKRQRREN